jgi:hypothetical protein
MGTRKAISTRTRFEVFKRDEFTCQYCGEHPPKVILHVDHVIPVCEGGDNSIDNLVTACQCCNLGKAGVSLDNVPQTLQNKALLALERRKQIEGYNAILAEIREREDCDVWAIANVLAIRHGHMDTLNRDYLRGIRTFLKHLDFQEVYEAMEYAVDRMPYSENKAFRYFCGICWKKIKGPMPQEEVA